MLQQWQSTWHANLQSQHMLPVLLPRLLLHAQAAGSREMRRALSDGSSSKQAAHRHAMHHAPHLHTGTVSMQVAWEM